MIQLTGIFHSTHQFNSHHAIPVDKTYSQMLYAVMLYDRNAMQFRKGKIQLLRFK